MKSIKFQKYSTYFEIKLLDNIEIDFNKIENIIDDFENIFSRFIKNSELYKINLSGGGIISSQFLSLLKLNISLYELTKGFFNPLICVENFGYSDKIIKNQIKCDNNLEKNLKLDGNNLIIKNNLKLDFGGSAKGYLVDLISEYLKEKGCKNFFINFGGDIYFSGNNNGKKWVVGIDNPFLKDKNLGIIELENMSISTSGSYKRNWEIKGKKYHHIINPKTNKNEDEIIMVSIIGEKTYFTDSIATAVFSMGIKNALDFLNKNNIDGIIISKNAKAHLTNNFTGKYNFKN